MLYTLENDQIKITADTHGGELHSLTGKKTETEYLWNGDKTYWRYHAPILFPIVGRVINNEYRIAGKTYELPAHGLARISEFVMLKQTTNSITFELTDSEESLQVYPYHFSLQITYTLTGNSVSTALTVTNPSAQPLFFSIGAHPAFMCPIDPNDSLSDCYLEFSQPETAPILLLAANGFLSQEKQPFLNSSTVLPLNQELFKNDALIFEQLKSNTVTIKSKTSPKSISITLTDFPWLGIWAPVNGAPFLCLEPWQGHADYADFTGELSDKAGIVKLAANASATYRYQTTISE